MQAAKKKICFVIPGHWSAINGGAEYQAKCILESLLLLNQYEIYYLARHVNDELTVNGYKVIKVSDPSGFRRFGEFFDTPSLLKLLNEISPNVIYQRVGCGYTGITAYYAKRKKCKLVWHIAHDKDVIPFDWKLSRNMMFRFIDKKVLEYGVHRADDIIAQTQQQGRLLQQYYGRTPTAIIPNAHPFTEQKIVKTNPVKIVWVANLKPWKKPELFLKLVRDLQYIKGIQFIMIGNPPRAGAWYNSLVEEMNDLENFIYRGKCTQEEVNTTLAAAHIFVNTSLNEGFPNTFIQAWLRKVPIVSLFFNPDNLLDSEKLGFYSSGSFERMEQNIIKLIEFQDLRESMGEYAQKYAQDNHSIKNFKKLIQVINS